MDDRRKGTVSIYLGTLIVFFGLFVLFDFKGIGIMLILFGAWNVFSGTRLKKGNGVLKPKEIETEEEDFFRKRETEK